MNWRIFVLMPMLCCLTAVNGYKVLVLGPVNGKSHFLYVSSFVRALSERGHEVTFLTSNSMKNQKLSNYTEVLIDPPFDMTSSFSQNDFIEQSSNSVIKNINILALFPKMMNEYSWENVNVQKFVKSTGLHFDVIVSEDFYSDSFLMFSHKFNAPIVTICPFGVTDFLERQQGLISPLSFVPHWSLPYSDNMSFMERWHNTFVIAYDYLVRHFIHLPSEEAFAKKYFAHLAPLPPLKEILNNVSIVLINTHRAITPPRPAMPNIIPIGGAHIKPAKPLPNDIKKFLDDAKHGAIYFSLGSVLQSSKMPKEWIQPFLSTFKNLKQRVLWKFEDESFTDIPSNVMIQKWLPQNDILAHPNVILFISHGGLFGTTESLYHGVPLLLIPFFGDQFRNAYRIETSGYGQYLDHREITEESLTKSITNLISDEKYLKKAKETSTIFKENLVQPMDEAMFWIEHVAKHKGAKHLKSHAVNMSWFTYFLVDIAIVDILIVLFVVFTLRMLIKKLCGKKNGSAMNKEKKQK